MKKTLILLSTAMLAIGASAPADAVSMKFVKRGFKHCTGKKGKCTAESSMGLSEVCKTGNFLWCKKNCGHKLDIDTVCNTAATVTMNVNKDIKYKFVGSNASGKTEYKLGKVSPGSIAAGKTKKIEVKRDPRQKDITHFKLMVGGKSCGRPLALGKNHKITVDKGIVITDCKVETTNRPVLISRAR